MKRPDQRDIVRTLERLRLHADITLLLKGGGRVTGIFEGLAADQVLLADGTETTYPREIPLETVANVLFELSSAPPE